MSGLTFVDICCFTLFSLLLLESDIVSAFDCVKTGPCQCQLNDGTVIDLSPLSSSDVNNPKFMDLPGPTTTDLYSWNPCADFSEGPDNCQNVAVCNIHQNLPDASYFSLGTTDSVTYTTDDIGAVTISYQYSQSGAAQRNSHILLSCDQSQEGTFTAQGPLPDPTSPDYYFALTSKYACASKPGGGGGGGSGGVSAGTIICIGVFAIAIVYVTVGISINVFYRKHIGVERLPNVTFWMAIPGLIRDGCKFILTCGRKSTVYDKI
ncbi:uncharacterized protein LOC117344001 [Pecten maximus]|uniref:uncharacterized protein LOC117344001 n=1 Tax=Pecten maximus TaxID=6579 RepID=UPI0014581E3D|nr:uncharacterized protein LOC117344001 [Pecten maximus]